MTIEMEVPFAGDPTAVMDRLVDTGRKYDAEVEVDRGRLTGRFLIKRLTMTLVEGTFVVQPNPTGSGHVAKVQLTRVPPMVSEDRVRAGIRRMFADQ